MKKKKMLKCKRPSCLHDWEQRGEDLPVRCPRCSSVNWNKKVKVAHA